MAPGRPSDGAQVHLSGPTAAVGATAGGGLAHLDNLVPGHYAVVVKRDGFTDAMVDADVIEGSSSGRVDIPLTRLARLLVRLVDLDGKPRAGLDYEPEVDGTKLKGTTSWPRAGSRSTRFGCTMCDASRP